MLLRLLALLCLLLAFQTALAQTPRLTLTDTIQQADLYPYLGIMQEPASGLQPQDLPSLPDSRFQWGWERDPQIGYSTTAWWGRFEVVNQASHQANWYLFFHNDQAGREIQVYTSLLPDTVTPLPLFTNTLLNAFRLELPDRQPRTIWIKISNLQRPLSFGALIYSQEAVIDSTYEDALFYGLIFGGLLALTTYNLLIFITLRETSFLSLGFFILTLGLVLTQHNGLLNHIVQSSNHWQTFISITPFLSISAAASFFYHLMDLPRQLPNLAHPVRWLFWASLLMIPVNLFTHFGGASSALLGTVLIGVASAATAILYRRGVSEARSFIWAFLVMLPCTIPVILIALGIMNNWPPAVDLLHVGFLGFAILLSLTQSERIRLLREQGQRADAANHAKGEFLATISHELRTPMNAVVSTGILLQHTTLTPQQQGYVDRLETSSRHMLNLINDVLDLASLESPRQVLEPRPFTLGELLANLDKLLQEHAQHKHLTLNLQSWFPTHIPLIGDATRLSQVLLNLLNNALKFTEQGQVELLIREFLQADPHKSLLHFVVVDTGIGLSQQQQERLFEPFSPVVQNTDRRYRGTGLGLSISSKLVAAMGGKLGVESTPGAGSRFFFTLEFPLYREEPPPNLPLSGEGQEGVALVGSSPDKGRPGGGSSHILLVDDDPLNLFFGQELLQMLGATVTTAASGTDAIHQLQQQTFDLVFMDVSMPGMDGYATTRRIRDLPHVASLPIIALTAHAIAGERERCLAAGMDDYLTKPFELEQLRSKVCQWTADAYNPPSPTQDRHKEPR